MRRDRLGKLFEKALALSAVDRAAWLDQTRRGDPLLYAELRSLLESHREAPDFLEGLPERVVARAVASLAESSPEQSALDRVGDRYEILERLGGGMGEVYKARDLRLGRFIALKFLPRYLSADDAARARLFAEAKAASVLDHPHIAVVHEIDETEAGQLFISMAFYEGETLRERLERGPLPVGDVYHVTRQIAAALATAHRAGIVHRDVKPSNVMLTADGDVKLVDFGIAKAAGVELTTEGVILGTVAYMSPEQTRGEATDPRTDLWSLGAVLYEMLTGVRPFRADSTQALIHAIRHDAPEPVRHARPDTPPGLERIVRTCLAKDPAHRYGDAEALIADLEEAERALGRARPARRTIASVSVIVLLLAILGGLVSTGGESVRSVVPPTAEMEARGPDRLAVLPLTDDGSDAEDAYLADALTDELIARISGLGELRVIARSSVARYRDSDMTAGEIGRELGAAAILRGRVRKSGERVDIALELIDSGSGERLWAESYPVGMQAVSAVPGEIAVRVAEALRIRIPSVERARLANEGTDNPQAYELYLKGRYYVDRWDEQAARRALASFQQALDLDPTYAHAWSGLAETYHILAGLSVLSADVAYPRSRAAAEKALELDDELAEAHSTLAMALSYHYLDPTAAERHFRRAIDLDPSHAGARGFYAEHLRNLGRFDEALVQVEVAQELNPLSSANDLEEGIILYVARRYDAAIEHYEGLLDLNPDFRIVHFFIALVQVQQGRYEEALTHLQAMDPQLRSPDGRSLRGYIYAMSGEPAKAREMLASLNESLEAPSRELDPSPFHMAVIHVALGEKERALDLLWEAYRERTWHVGLLKVEPLLVPLHTEPRFQDLLERVGLNEPTPPFTPVSRPR